MRTAAQETAGDSVAKILALCAPGPNRNMETELWRRRKYGDRVMEEKERLAL